MTQSQMSENDFWNVWDGLLKPTIVSLLSLPPGNYPLISYEQTYSAVYKCVCHGFQEPLYKKLIELVHSQLEHWSQQLNMVSDDHEFTAKMKEILSRFNDGIKSIIAIFNYMNRFYIEAKLNKNLRTEFMQICAETIVEPHCDRLMRSLHAAEHVPFMIRPDVMENLVKIIYELRPGLALENPQLFGRFIPNLSPTCSEQLPELIREAQVMSQSMRENFEEPADPEMDVDSAGTMDRGKKRPFEDAIEFPAAAVLSAKQFAQTGENVHNH